MKKMNNERLVIIVSELENKFKILEDRFNDLETLIKLKIQNERGF